ncbi:MAG: response regulator transcription factor [Acidobacteriaceae bacterium]|nr:response regulator transcription factor [Acidobacteriaceae bacterium]
MTTGNPNKQIADQLSIMEETVKSRVKLLLSHLGASDRTQAAMIESKRGFVELWLRGVSSHTRSVPVVGRLGVA